MHRESWPNTPPMMLSTSHWAGGMLAPWCEAEVAEPVISRLGLRSLDLWRQQLPDTPFNGSLVVAHARDRTDFERFATMTSNHRRLDARTVEVRAATAELKNTTSPATSRGPTSTWPG